MERNERERNARARVLVLDRMFLFARLCARKHAQMRTRMGITPGIAYQFYCFSIVLSLSGCIVRTWQSGRAADKQNDR